MEPEEFEKAYFNKLLYDFPHPEFLVTHDDREMGRFSKSNRRLDITVRRDIGYGKPIYILADSKNWKRKIGLKTVEGFLGMVEDVNAEIGILISPLGPTKFAKNRAKTANMVCETLTHEEAIEMNYRKLARLVFPHDWVFHPQMATAFRALEKGDDERFIETLEPVPFEEWDAVVETSLRVEYLSRGAIKALKTVAINHYDSGWRWNAIDKLSSYGELSPEMIYSLLEKEVDAENRELLKGLSAQNS